MTSAWGRQGDEAELYARYAPKLRRIVAQQSGPQAPTSRMHAWLPMLRYQPARGDAAQLGRADHDTRGGQARPARAS